MLDWVSPQPCLNRAQGCGRHHAHELVQGSLNPMAVLNVLHFPDPRLRRKARPVEVVDDALKKTVQDMFETMYDAPGIGLAATQVNILQQVAVIDVSEDKSEPRCLINPNIIEREGEEAMREGCLSVPEVFAHVKRAQKITVEALDLEGRPMTLEAEDLLAVCIQHEIDHLQGRLFIDYLSPLQRARAKKKLLKAQRAVQTEPGGIRAPSL